MKRNDISKNLIAMKVEDSDGSWLRTLEEIRNINTMRGISDTAPDVGD